MACSWSWSQWSSDSSKSMGKCEENLAPIPDLKDLKNLRCFFSHLRVLMAELATFPAMESSYELLESLRIQLPDYEICKVSDTKMTLLPGVPLDFLMYLDGWFESGLGCHRFSIHHLGFWAFLGTLMGFSHLFFQHLSDSIPRKKWLKCLWDQHGANKTSKVSLQMVLWCVLCFPSHLSDGQHHSGRSHRYQVRLLAVINHWMGLFGNIFTGNHGLCTWNLRGCPVNCPCLHQSIDSRWFLHFPIGKPPFEMENPFREYHILTILSQVPFPALHQDCKVHERECNEQRERVKAKVKTGISLHLAIKNEKSPSHRPMTIGKAEQLMSYEISFTKNGALASR